MSKKGLSKEDRKNIIKQQIKYLEDIAYQQGYEQGYEAAKFCEGKDEKALKRAYKLGMQERKIREREHGNP